MGGEGAEGDTAKTEPRQEVSVAKLLKLKHVEDIHDSLVEMRETD